VGLVRVTGVSGTGKSSVCEGLRQRGHRAVDADGDGYSRWADRRSGRLVADPPDPVPAGRLDRYAWRIDVERVRALATGAPATVTFLCGSVENEHDVWDCFDRVVCLVADDETIIHRLATRTTNAFGKHPEELAATLGWNQVMESRYRAAGAAIVDATRPLADVVDDVLTATQRRPG